MKQTLLLISQHLDRIATALEHRRARVVAPIDRTEALRSKYTSLITRNDGLAASVLRARAGASKEEHEGMLRLLLDAGSIVLRRGRRKGMYVHWVACHTLDNDSPV